MKTDIGYEQLNKILFKYNFYIHSFNCLMDDIEILIGWKNTIVGSLSLMSNYRIIKKNNDLAKKLLFDECAKEIAFKKMKK